MIASASHAVACSPGMGPTPSGLVYAHVVAKVKLAQVEDSNVPYALLSFDTRETYSGEEQPEWQVVWQKGLSSLSEPVPFGMGVTYIVGLIRPNRDKLSHCPRGVLPCIRKEDGTYYPVIMTHWCYAPASHAFPFSHDLEVQIRELLEASQ